MDTVSENSIKGSLPIYEIAVKPIKEALQSAASFDEAKKKIKALPLNKTFLSEFSTHLQNGIETADAIGRSQIVEKDKVLSGDESPIAGKIHYNVLEWFVADGGPVNISFDLIPQSALDYLREKSLTIAGVESQDLLDTVQQKLVDAVESGVTFSDWQSEIDQLFDSYGITPMSNMHAQTVFRTNIFSSYAIGQLDQVNDMSDRFPMWKYSAIMDARTRPEHAALNGTFYNVGEGPLPPIDYNCRCTAIYLHSSQTDGLVPQKWDGSKQATRFNTRKSFDVWKQSKPVSKDIQNWIEDQS